MHRPTDHQCLEADARTPCEQASLRYRDERGDLRDWPPDDGDSIDERCERVAELEEHA